MADINKNVGSTAPAQDYATLTLWNAGEGAADPGVGFKSIANCYGDCGSTATINGAFIRGAIVQGNVLYDGSNQSSLVTVGRVNLSTADVIIKHMKLTNNNGFDNAVDISGANSYAEDCHVEDTSTSSTSYGATQIRGAATNKGLTRVTISATCAQLVRTGFDGPCNLTNVTGWGATNQGILASGSNQALIDCFFFDCNSQAFNGAFMTETNLASDDVTATYTPYTSSELVNFAGDNFQVKSTSFLATAGVASGVVGAYLEVSSGISVTATLGTIDYNSNDAVVGLTGSVDITATLGTISYSSNDTTVGITGSVDVIATLGTIDYSSNDVSIQISGETNVTATLGTIEYSSSDTVVSLFGNVDVVATLGTISYDSNDVSIGLTGGVSVNATLGTIDYTSNDTAITLQGQVSVIATLGTISYDSNNVTIQVGTGQFIGAVTAGFADDLYSAGFKPSEITVSFKS